MVATDQNYLRFFSLGGVQRGVQCLKGGIVGMVGNDDCIMIAYHAGSNYLAGQNIEFILIDSNKKVLVKESVALSPGATLTWLGFSEEGMPLSFDSIGILRGFLRSSTAWIPLLDTRIRRAGKQEVNYPVGVFEDSFMCIICKGGDKHPPFPKPMIMEVPLSIPFLGMDEGLSGAAEEKHYRGVVMLEMMGEGGEVAVDVVKKRAGLDKAALHLHLV